ncbi:MAG TPA: leucyl/phenylalanyl-tRNA--protein transferase [Thermoanaerobaculia bacterium]|jgi:leucyl/phenylalanyl-tRNA--protein transferase|nr:leucyl/phenylalanyl-tRNA--protein transferase [Thermoanaerobaculia bacterium]
MPFGRRFLFFPPVSWASPDGVLAVGGRPDPETLKAAYTRGIFPWPHDGLPLLWFCPDPRFVLVPEEAHVSRSLRKEMRRGTFEVRADTAFREVIRGCSSKPRPGQGGTWITRDMIEGYTGLHEEGLAHSIEAWQDGRLAGGLYGVSLGSIFFGESMFANAPNASKVAFATLLANLLRWRFALVDCQSYTEHLENFGAVDWPRARFLAVLKKALREPTRSGPWELELGPAEAADVFREDG